MKKFFLLSIALTSLSHAEVIQDKVHSVENGLVKFQNGRVAYMDQKNLNLKSEDYVHVEVDDTSTILSYKKMTPPAKFESMSLLEETTPAAVPYEPTIVQGMEEAWNIFNRSNSNYKRISECSDRAHVWANDEFKKNGIKSEKIFVFFTASYINSVRFKWWFHVAPLYTVATGSGLEKLVMDYRYTDRPMTVKEWTDKFVYTKRDCKVTDKFSEYDVNPQTENCYVIYRSMHYKLPIEIQAEEQSGQYKTTSSESEIRASYNYAFNK